VPVTFATVIGPHVEVPVMICAGAGLALDEGYMVWLEESWHMQIIAALKVCCWNQEKEDPFICPHNSARSGWLKGS